MFPHRLVRSSSTWQSSSCHGSHQSSPFSGEANVNVTVASRKQGSGINSLEQTTRVGGEIQEFGRNSGPGAASVAARERTDEVHAHVLNARNAHFRRSGSLARKKMFTRCGCAGGGRGGIFVVSEAGRVKFEAISGERGRGWQGCASERTVSSLRGKKKTRPCERVSVTKHCLSRPRQPLRTASSLSLSKTDHRRECTLDILSALTGVGFRCREVNCCVFMVCLQTMRDS